MIPRETIDKVFAAAKIEEVVGDYVKLKRRGANYIGLCPFHTEKTSSFTVSPSKSLYKCFGCGKSGNAVGFLMEHEHYSYPEALHWLADKYHIHIEEEQMTEEQKERQTERDGLFLFVAGSCVEVEVFINDHTCRRLHRGLLLSLRQEHLDGIRRHHRARDHEEDEQ